MAIAEWNIQTWDDFSNEEKVVNVVAHPGFDGKEIFRLIYIDHSYKTSSIRGPIMVYHYSQRRKTFWLILVINK